MHKYLVIVESPAKVKTISKFLGANYKVMASQGHVRDLPKSQMGVDIEHDYEPKYITIRGKGDILAALRKEAKKADKVYLATDPDREGEAISWHLAAALKLEDKDIYRITFNEITKNAVKASLKEARKIDMNLVDAQQARRVLDRVVGYGISPLLWAKIKRGLSAGRVQSVALRMICDRENEIDAFIPEEYWSMEAVFDIKGEKKPLIAKFYGDENGKIEIKNGEQMQAILDEVKKSDFSIESIKRGEKVKKSPLPFTTSTLQQEAAKTLNMSTKRTMNIAQQLYEGVDIKGRGTVGLITYLRTDSTRVADEAKVSSREYISENYGDNYIPKEINAKKDDKKIQDAHEAIRPTDLNLSPTVVKESLQRDQFRLYQLIWKRFVASQMAPAVYETTSVRIAAGKYRFSVAASKVVFDGFMSVYKNDDDNEETNTLAKGLDENSVLSLSDINGTQHFTQPPAHFTEASLVKALEEQGIGRPSTYAPTISTIIARHYVIKENKNLYISELGNAVNNIMLTAFPTIVDVKFTANMESLLDGVAEGTVEWKEIIRNFYPDLKVAIDEAEKELEHVKIEDEVTDVICDKCGRNMVIKYGPHGKFLGCPGFPECHNTKPYLEKIGVPCPKCGKDVIIKKTKKGRTFYGCDGYPDCDFVSWQRPSEKKCPKCGGYMVEKGNKLVCADETCGYVENKNDKE
ncbi:MULTISPECIES: type I DNA topoisomerase [Clostridia]|jgi:DNA topoisomerase-1|uniref:type I DNA topoisomerase n=1 Tax=Clostridia TaxID=186801 RepID=UPI000E5DA672|nr:type I DNA topoisomerase [Eubacterium sp. AF22-9]RGS32863.1 type I DNA topoisomerase [Eubacterium sp. AF22-9]HAS07056.1 type I DNA topoisomerase [Eubacterium sp.]HCO36430.1 type I DNA topoisomerase [Eubacterium sp.]